MHLVFQRFWSFEAFPRIAILPPLILIIFSCNGAKFATQHDNEDPPPETPKITEPIVEPPTTCLPTTPSMTTKPIDVAILLDNSGSNATTDCPLPQAVPGNNKNSSQRYRCSEPTEREKAVATVFDELVVNPENRLAIASFPTLADPVAGWSVSGQSPIDSNIGKNLWIMTKPAERDRLAALTAITREPFGYTPYGAAMNAARALLLNSQDARTRLALLITDGEPTDQDPTAAAKSAAILQEQGVQIVTVMITSGVERQARRARHVDLLSDYNQNGRWWERRESIQSFDEYIDYLLGSEDGSTLNLAGRLSSKTDPACIDKAGAAPCPRQIIEITDAAALGQVLKKVVKTVVTPCKTAAVLAN